MPLSVSGESEKYLDMILIHLRFFPLLFNLETKTL